MSLNKPQNVRALGKVEVEETICGCVGGYAKVEPGRKKKKRVNFD